MVIAQTFNMSKSTGVKSYHIQKTLPSVCGFMRVTRVKSSILWHTEVIHSYSYSNTFVKNAKYSYLYSNTFQKYLYS